MEVREKPRSIQAIEFRFNSSFMVKVSASEEKILTQCDLSRLINLKVSSYLLTFDAVRLFKAATRSAIGLFMW